MEKITQEVLDKMAQGTEDFHAYIMATKERGLALLDKQDYESIVTTWNRHHPDKRLPMPRVRGR